MPESIESQLASYAERIDDLLLRTIPRDGFAHLSEPIWHHLDTGGKRIRPALCLYTCEALGGKVEDSLSFAVAVEILHNMFLIHDDLEDGDIMRRDAPTVWIEYGTANAVNAGDFMLGRAYGCILDSPLPVETRLRLVEVFTQTYETTCKGQALDINCRAADPFAVEDYMHIARLKTGRYLVLGMAGGALIAGAGDDALSPLWELGENMGPAFQIRDDMIDLTQGKGRGGVVGSDIREGKPSILYAYAMENSEVDERETLRRIMATPREETRPADVEWVIRLYERLNALDFARAKADDLIQEAVSTIDRIPVEDKSAFRRIARYMVERSS